MKYSRFVTCVVLLTVTSFIIAAGADKLASDENKKPFPWSLAVRYSKKMGNLAKVKIERSFSGEGVEELELNTTSVDVVFVPEQSSKIKIELEAELPGIEKNQEDFLETKPNGKTLSITVKERDFSSNGTFKFQVDDDATDPKFNIHFEKAEGKLKVKIPASIKRVVLKSISGDVVMQKIKLQELKVDSVSGGVELEGTQCKRLELKTISGDLKALGTVSELSAETVSGDVSLMFQNQDPMVDLKTTSGDVEFGFPQKPDIKLHFSTVSGDMEVDDEFGMGDFEGTNISFQLGSGKGAVSVNTVSGDLSIGAKNRF